MTDTSARVKATGGVEAVTRAVAEHVRTLRLARGWSLDELSGRSGVSKGMVVQIEGARTNPSVGTLCRLADAFGITVARLLEPASDRTVRISVADDAPMLWRGGYGGFGRLLGGLNEPECVELWEWRLRPRDRHDSSEHAPGTRELLHVLLGDLTVIVDGTAYTVRGGETMEFLADKPHSYLNDGETAVRMLLVAVMTPGAVDRRRRDPR